MVEAKGTIFYVPVVEMVVPTKYGNRYPKETAQHLSMSTLVDC